MFAMHLWEKREVPRPPEYTIEYSLKELKQNNLGKCVRPLLDGISRGHTALIDQRVSASLRREVGILTALLYRNGRHRTEKFYRVLKKVEKNCARWQKLDVVEELDRLCQLMPRMILERKTVRLPSKQMFEYLLARLLGSYHFMLHLDGICKEAATLLLSKIATGHFFSTAVAFLSNVARIRILALDYGGQVAKIYDDILPKVILLKGSNAPPLLDTATLPSSLSSLLQQYCASFDVNRNPLPVNKPSSDISFLNLLNISKEEDSTKASEFDDFIDSPVTNNLVNEELCNPKNEISDSLDMPVSNCYLEEDIGECVPKTKPPKKAKTLKKRKLSLETNGNTETNDGCSSKKKKVKSDAGKNLLLNSKKKKTKKNVLKSGIGKIKQNKVKKSLNEPDEEHCSAAFIKHFKAVKKQTKNINSIDSLKRFLEGEKKNRSEKVNGRVSKLLKKEDWTEFAKFLRIRLKNIEGLSKMDSGESEALQQLLGKTRVRVKFWLLFPYLKGKKPGNWKTVLGNLSS
ncbi:uncharacterized protein LOC123513093 isoform X2 [Portunus trituberculatus]|uniref:uncharacterized protein LOC123513093 isoform X2 n=1 Tax=Portunus trituberculatus TaxID=210409 RepID=UPI001E1CD461|nr:uncharacterized protein LOC123513093 isoform X2 [Portunus trituberculatus]